MFIEYFVLARTYTVARKVNNQINLGKDLMK